MELPQKDIDQIHAMVRRWIGIDTPGLQQELESTFDGVDATTFLAIAQRLQDKGYKAEPQEDRLSIITQKQIRVSLQGLGVLETYCKNNTIANIRKEDFSALRKNVLNEKDTLRLEEYNVKLKSRTEETLERGHPELQDLFRTWAQQPKAFRLIKRWSFLGEGMRIDMSIVRSTPKTKEGDYMWRKNFLEPYRNKQTLFQQPLQYEVEVELIHKPNITKEMNISQEINKSVKNLIRGIGEVLRAIQGNSLLIRKSVRDTVLAEYRALVKFNGFVGCPPVTLERKNMEPIPVATKKGGGDGFDDEFDDEFDEFDDETDEFAVEDLDETDVTDEEGNLIMDGGAGSKVKSKSKSGKFGKSAGKSAGKPDKSKVKVKVEGKKPAEKFTKSDPNIRDAHGYNVTDKADGLRCLGFVNSKGELYLIDRAFHVYRTGYTNADCANSLVDGEWITKGRDNVALNMYGIFDIFVANEKDVSQLPFATFRTDEETTELNEEAEDSRYGTMSLWIETWKEKATSTTTKFDIRVKTFQFASPANPEEIFDKCNLVLTIPQAYHTDGLILTPNHIPLPIMGRTFFEQFKWKPAADNSVDFLVSIDPKIYRGFNEDGSVSVYKQLTLYVNANKDPAYDNPRKTILYMLPLPENTERDAMQKAGKKVVYQPSEFTPRDPPDSMASRCYLDVQTQELTGEQYVITETGEPIQNMSIVEMRYDITNPPGRRWIPMRIRHDKTERYARAVAAKKGDIRQTINSDKTANSVWSSIYNPITVSMIRTGAMTPSEEEQKAAADSRYYNRQASKKDLEIINGLRAFHNRYIKQQILYGSVLKRPGMKILDMACGQAGDIGIWNQYKASVVVGVDTAIEGLQDKKNGAYARYMNYMIQNGPTNVPRMIFIHGDSAKSFADGAAGIPLYSGDTEEGDMLVTVLGKGLAKGPLPPFVTKMPAEGGMKGVLSEGADVASCMFALHYFFKDKPTLDGFLENLRDNVKTGGYFIACFTDGDTVFNLLKRTKEGVAVGKDRDVLIWSIRDQYTNTEFGKQTDLPSDDTSLGLPIDIKFISLGEEVHTEYLISHDYLITRLKEYGFSLLNAEELKAIDLKFSTNTFDKSYGMLSASDKKNYKMNKQVETYSFTNRWLIVKKRDGIDPDTDAFGGPIATSTVPDHTDETNIATQVADALKKRLAATAPGAPNISTQVADALKKRLAETAEATATATTEATEATGATTEGKTTDGGGKTIDVWNHDSDYTPETVFLFGPEVSLTANPLNKEDKFYPRKLSPIWQFMIKEKGTTELEYPSLEHFWAAMKVLYAGKGTQPTLKALATSFSCDGSIHREAKERLTKEVKDKHALSTQNTMRMKIALEEYKKIRQAADTIAYDDTKWVGLRDKYLRYGLEQRWNCDKEFHETVEALRQKNVYLLYSIGPHLGDPTGIFAGKVQRNKTISGDNLIGRMIMELAKFRI